MQRAWMVRAGSDGEWEQDALNKGMVAAAWSGHLGDLSLYRDRDALQEAVAATYPRADVVRIRNWTGQLWKLADEMSEGDWVVLPLKSAKQVAIGRITGSYAFRKEAPTGLQHTRPVEWRRTDLPREDIKPDLRNMLGSLLTICELSRFDAVSRLGRLANDGVDPGTDKPEELRGVDTVADLAKTVAANGPVPMTIRDLLALWDAGSRNSAVVDRVRADLAGYGLSTTPPFTDGSIDTLIKVLSIGTAPETVARNRERAFHLSTIEGKPPAENVPEAADGPPEEIEEIDAATAPEIGLRISHLLSAANELISIPLDSDVVTAQTTMLDNGYDQLAVVDGGSLVGSISWRSIGRARISHDKPTIADALEDGHRRAGRKDELLGWIDDIVKTGYVFVVNADGTPAGIVTAADVSERFGEDLRPTMILEEIERRLRRALSVFTAEELYHYAKQYKHSTIADKKRLGQLRPLSPDDLVFGEYYNLLENDEAWERLGWKISQQILLARLDEVRKIRNSVAHYHPDPLSANQIKSLEGLRSMVRAAHSDARPGGGAG
ncbi:CBS domain-containing protein [Streptomyces carpaticus]|uniref:CBS domain-containing protein n=1 Tax=Streptomyces carpaticus TaxID=285558 RepID=UPI0022034B80|nr:CBS domain-containing protein [Streptomyces carpaticus]